MLRPLLPAYATSAALSVQCTYIIALQITVDNIHSWRLLYASEQFTSSRRRREFLHTTSTARCLPPYWTSRQHLVVSAFFVTVRAGTAYRKIWRLVNNVIISQTAETERKLDATHLVLSTRPIFSSWTSNSFAHSFYFAPFCKWIEVIEENAIVIRFLFFFKFE